VTKQVYTYGYQGHDPDELHKIALTLNATVFDIRFSPRSRNYKWSGSNLQNVLGDRYRHVRAFGNKNYKGGPIELVNFASGLEQVLDSPRPVILMCVCKDPSICHRTTIANILKEMGLEVEELTGPVKPKPSSHQMAFEF
jgi:uncharacterized protein (DUF488 family)